MGVMEARRRILLNQPHLIDASGNPIAFQTDMAAKMGVKAYFSPVQEGTGDPSPQNVRPISGWQGCNVTRCGKNLLDMSTDNIEVGKYITATGEIGISDANFYTKSYVRVSPLSKCTFSFSQNVYYFRVSEYAQDKTFIQRTEYGTWANNITINLTSNTYYVRICCNLNGNTIVTIAHIQAVDWMMVFGESASPYTPYSGTEYPVTFPGVGKNKLNINAPYQQPSDTYYMPTTKRIFKPNTYNVGSSLSNYFGANNILRYEIANGTLTFKSQAGYGIGFAMNLAPGNYCLSYTLVSGSLQSYVAYYAQDGTYISEQVISNTFTVPENADITVVGFTTYLNTSDDESATDIQVESGSTATAYEPFTNTIYGGYVDYERGEVVAEWGYIASYNGETIPGEWMSDRDVYAAGTSPTTGAEVVYELTTPITYSITPQIIKSLKGANTIWSDMNGNLEISYWKH